MLAILAAAIVAGVPTPESGVTSSSPAFQLLEAGSGVSHVLPVPLDTLFASEMTGSWFALRGDGTTSGNLALSAVGSPVTQVDRVCPNGPDCAAVTSQRTASGNYYKTADGAFGPTAFSVCALVNTDSISAGTQRIAAKDDGTASRTYSLHIHTSGGFFVFSVYASGGTAAVAAGVPVGATWMFVCGTHESGSSLLFLNGAQVGTSGLATGTVNSYADSFHAIGSNDLGTEPFAGRYAHAFLTEKVLSSTTIAAMNTAVHATLQGSRGASTTTTRTTTRSCIGPSGGSLLAAGRPCVKQGGVEVYAAGSQLLARFDDIANGASGVAPWGVINSATLLGEVEVGAFGVLNVTRITDPGASASGVSQTVTTAIGTSYTFSCRMKAGTLAAVELVLNGVGGDTVALTSDWAYYSMTRTAVGTSSLYILRGTAAGVGTFFVDHCQVEAGSIATPVIPSYATVPVTRNADGVATSLTLGTSGCIAATVQSSATAATRRVIGWNTASHVDTPLYISGATTLGCYMSSGGSLVIDSVATAPRRVIGRWTPTTCQVEYNGTRSAAFAATVTAPSTVSFGSLNNGLSNHLNGTISDVVFSNDPEGCR